MLAAFKRIMSIPDSKTAWIQVACYLFVYGCFAIPAALFIKKHSQSRRNAGAWHVCLGDFSILSGHAYGRSQYRRMVMATAGAALLTKIERSGCWHFRGN